MTTPTPHEVKFALELKALELAVTVTGVHSVCLIDDDGPVVDVIFDVEPDPCGCGLHFMFPLPELVGRDVVREFSEWLVWSDVNATVH
jgi:hypothetical protein